MHNIDKQDPSLSRRTALSLIGASILSTAFTPKPSASKETSKVSSEVPMLMSQERHDYFATMLRDTGLEKYAQALNDGRLMFYSEEEIPSAFQMWSSSDSPNNFDSDGVLSNDRILNREQQPSHGNKEFPWATTAGLNSKAPKFIILPKGTQIEVWRQRLSQDGNPSNADMSYRADSGFTGHSFVWRFPKGTELGELVLVEDSESGGEYLSELRVRRKSSDSYGALWRVNSYVPYPPSANELVATIKELRPHWRDDPQINAFVNNYTNYAKHDIRLLDDNSDQVIPEELRDLIYHDKISFKNRSLYDKIPELPADLVKELLELRPFRSRLGTPWLSQTVAGERYESASPASDYDFHIVPKNDLLSYFDVNSTSCMQCHDSTLADVREFQPGLPGGKTVIRNDGSSTSSRDWYGRIRGSDGIFSFHPFNPADIVPPSHSSFGETPEQKRQRHNPSLRKEFLDSGMITYLGNR